MTAVDIFCTEPALAEPAETAAAALQVAIGRSTGAPYALRFDPDGVFLASTTNSHGRIQIDFCAGGAAHRRLYGGGKSQLIAKAVGLTGKIRPAIFDATAGLGGDAFVLACLGCEMTLMERNPVAFALLQDGLRRAHLAAEEDAELAVIVQRMRLIPGDSIHYMRGQPEAFADVIYLDPMFPERLKSAAVKKEMQAFHQLVGQDDDGRHLLGAALDKALYRVVVKRPRLAPPVGDIEPNHRLEGKSSRFDIYALRSQRHRIDS